MRVLVTRPEPDATALKAQLSADGHAVFVEPLLSIHYQPIDPDDLIGVQAFIATSRNGLRALAASDEWDAVRDVPVFTVGPGTAQQARQLGMSQVMQGPRSGRELVPIIAEVAEVNAGPLVHLAGETLAFDLGAELVRLGFHVLQPVVYHSVASEAFSEDAIRLLKSGGLDAVILLSPQTGTIYVDLVGRHGLVAAARKPSYICLSEAVADRLEGLGAVRKLIAAAPNIEEILGLARSVAAQSAPPN